MTIYSFDVNATRARSVAGPADGFPLTVPLEPPHADLPLVLCTERHPPEVGRPGLLVCRERPEVVYRGFLGGLNRPDAAPAPATRRRPGDRRPERGDAYQALRFVFRKLQSAAGHAECATLALPPYLEAEQLALLDQAARDCLPTVGAVVSPLAVALSGYAEAPWKGQALVVDADDHALWLSLVQEEDGVAYHAGTYTFAHLALVQWRHRLLNALADCCILHSRRDPRDHPAAEQSLYLQLDGVMEHCFRGQPAGVAFQTPNWYQHLNLTPEHVEGFCAALAHDAVAEVVRVLRACFAQNPVTAILLTAEAASLPGLTARLEEYLEAWTAYRGRAGGPARLCDPDGGAGDPAVPRLAVLSPEAAARGAHLLAGVLADGEAGTPVCESAPLPGPQPPEAGPARLHFQGRDYLLGERPFLIGRRHDCHLVLATDRYPGVAPCHCEVIFDPRSYLLRDHSHEGTWVNDAPVHRIAHLQPGDWIRVGPGGPALRYLGRPEARSLHTA